MKFLKFIFVLSLLIASFIGLRHEQYHNPYKSGDPDFIDFIKWKLTRSNPAWPKLPAQNPNQPVAINDRVYGQDLVLTYINHSTTLLQTGGKNILTDPIWSSHAGPFGKLGPERSIYPGITMQNLPPIDVILISHSHYDHLDLPSLKTLSEIHKPLLIMGLGVSRYIDYCQSTPNNCVELNWWEGKNSDGISYNFVPAYHWSSRYLLDKNTSLWGGFVISQKDSNIYFAGDTGFSDGKIFHEIKKKYGDFRLSLLPIGAYKPSWFFSHMHTSPAEAVEIFKILQSDYAVPIHFDTFELTDDEYTDPLKDLTAALKTNHISNEKFKVLSPGQSWKTP